MTQAAISQALAIQLPVGTATVECCIPSTVGVRVPDVARACAECMARHGKLTPLPSAPEICVKVRAPSNTGAGMAFKTRLFLDAGALEVWSVSEHGDGHIFDARGAQPASPFGVHLGLTA